MPRALSPTQLTVLLILAARDPLLFALAAPKAKLADAVVVLHTADGEELRAFCDSDGSFELSGVTPGSHMAQAHLIGHYFPEV